MSEPDRKRRKYRTEHNANPGPGPPVLGEMNCDDATHEQLDEQNEWKRFNLSVENLNDCLVTRCVCPWNFDDYQNIVICSGNKCSEIDNQSEILLFCSIIQLLCEEIARQSNAITRSGRFCLTLKRLRVLLFHLNSVSDPTCLLQCFLRSSNQFISFAAARSLSAWLKAADEGACKVLLDRLLDNIVSEIWKTFRLLFNFYILFQISPLATSLSTLNTSGAHGPLPHTVSNLLDILKSCIEAPDVEPHPTEGATEDESEDASFESNGNTEIHKVSFSWLTG